MTNKTLDLMRKYSVDIADMCKGTELEGRELTCIQYKIQGSDSKYLITSLDHFIALIQQNAGIEFIFAVAELDGKPVFVGDEVYRKTDGFKHVWESDWKWANDWSKWTWNKPTTKRTFQLNGVELPCPVPRSCAVTPFVLTIETHGDQGFSNQINFYFESNEEQNKTTKTIINLLTEARDK